MKILLLFSTLWVCLAQADSITLFNGRDLSGWKPAAFDGGGAATVLSNGTVQCGMGAPLSGIVYTNAPLTMNYEIRLEALRAEGSDFFIGLTIPVEKSFCTVIIGGWGGGLCGVSSVDYTDASENQWGEGLLLENNRWYTLRVRVTPGVLQVFLNKDLYTARIEFGDSKRLSLRPGDIDKTVPLGLSTYRTRALWRNFTLTPITVLKADDKPREE